MADEEIHIGHIIQQRLLSEERTVSWLARKLNCDRSNIYRIFEKQSISIDLLWRLSEVLNYNFFDVYSRRFKEREEI